MQQIVNKKYAPLFTEKPRYLILMGGRGGGRSTVASQFANARLVAPEYFRCAIMRYVLGDIRNSIWQEIVDRATETGSYPSLQVNETMMSMDYGANSINAVGFKKQSGEQKSKLKSLASYNCVIIEEADEIPEEDFMQLDDSLRTLKGDILIILLLNCPPKTHWIIKRWFELLPSGVQDFYIPKLRNGIQNTKFIYSSYKDNVENLSPQTVYNYELYKENKPDYYYNMIVGLVPETVRGKIYKDWAVIEKVPHEARLERYGLDFGYTNDPTAIVAVYKYNDGYILDEVIYQTGLLNNPIAAILKNQPQAVVIADSAEPKSIEEIRINQITILPAVKGADSRKNGIAVVQGQRISVTKRSINIIKEYESYAWLEDKEGKNLNEPKPGNDHTMDAIRYALASLLVTLSSDIVKVQASHFKSVMNRQQQNSAK